ncbi:MAG: carboxypeptidase regulatory-like domain-containing protein [Terriglobia bacterium]|jgi:hypothetical protein|nr:carboxypeptidase regulatory-like domain-containing protein [Terriglobia bacterium]
MKTKILLTGLVLLLATVAFAQSDRATITGTVKDATQAVVPGVQVRVTNVGTNDVTTTTTNSDGIYRVSNLPIGNYSIVFSKDGFKNLERNGLTLLVSQVATIDVALQVGTTGETVEVTAAAPMLQSEDAVISTNLTNNAISQLPINVQGSRNLSNFMFQFVPGVEGSDYSSHINGGIALTKEVMIDGSSAVSQLGGYISESQPPMEAVQEFEVDSAGISGDAGRSGGGVFRYEMKSGTNNFHGSLFGFMHSTALDALSAQNHLSAQNDPANAAAYLRKSDSLSDWGGGIGGPIIKDKLFFFAAFERYMQSMWSLGANTRTVPTDAMMGLNPDGSVASYANLSPMLSTNQPLGTDSCGNTVYLGGIFNPSTGCVFVGNMIPTSMISTTSAQILQLYHQYYQPESSNPANNAGQAYNPDPWFHNTQTSVKIDFNASDRHHINSSFYYDNYPRINADQGGVWSATAPYGGPMANSYWHNTTAPSFRISDSYTFSPHVLNVFHATFNRFRNPSSAVSQAGGWDSKLGLLNGAGNFPLIVFSSGMYTNWGNYQNGWAFSNLGSQFNDFYAGNTFIYSDEVDWNKGRHNMKFGAEFRAMQMNEHPDNNIFNNITFDPTSTAGAWWNYGWNTVGNAFASFLLGDVYLATEMPVDPEYGRRKSFALYATDDFKVNDRLTVNLGLRWDYNNPFKEKYGHWSSFVTGDVNTVTGSMGQYEYLTSGSQSFEKRQEWFNFAPHVGAAYRLNDKTVIRGNFSVFFVPLNMNQWGGVPYQQTGNPGYYQHAAQSNFNWDNGFQPVLSQVQTPDYTQWGTVSIDPRSLILGNTQQWNIGVQRELARDTKIDVNWIQSHSYHLHSGFLATNQPTLANLQAYINNGNACPANLANVPFAGGGPGWQCITPYPQAAVGYGPLFSVGSPLGNADYKSLQFTVTKRAGHGLSLMGSYNWSRTHGDVDSDMGEPWWAGNVQNIYDLATEAKGISGFDMTHIVKGYVIYDLPFGKGKMLFSGANSVADAIIGGWSLNGDFHYNTGTPIQLHSSNSYPGFNSVYVNLVPGCKFTNGSPALNKMWLNTDCFQNPTYGQMGTAGNYLSQVRNPGMATEDLGLHKAISMGERYKLALRLEFFNVFNRHNLAGPVTNMNDQNYGKIINYGNLGGRVGQFGARFTF